MAFLTATALNDLQASQAFNEKRNRRFGLVDLAYDGRSGVDYLPPDAIEKLRKMSSARDYQLPVIKDQSVTVTTTPGFANIPINLGTTANYYFTAYDVFSGFRFFPAAHQNNQVSMEFYRDTVMKNVLEAMAAQKETVLKTVADLRKTQVLSYTDQINMGDGNYNFNTTDDQLEIGKDAQKELMFHYLNTVMNANKLQGNYSIATSPAGLAVANAEAAKYGMNNNKDISWGQSAIPFENRYESDVITTSENFNGYLVRDGALSFYSNHPYDFMTNTKVAGKEWSVSDMELPFIKSQANIFINTEATDASSLVTSDSNMTMTHWEEMAIWDRFYVIYRYNSDLTTRANDIVKLVGLKTNPGE